MQALSFEYSGLPFLEPGFGTLVESPLQGVCVHGAAHLLSTAQLDRLRATEGGGGRDDVPGYRLREVTAEAYDGRRVRAVALVGTPEVLQVGRFRICISGVWRKCVPSCARHCRRARWVARGTLTSSRRAAERAGWTRPTSRTWTRSPRTAVGPLVLPCCCSCCS